MTSQNSTEQCLSVPQFRPSLELKEVLLHEMVHAWMFLQKIKDTGDHGARFQERMNFINRATFQARHAVARSLWCILLFVSRICLLQALCLACNKPCCSPQTSKHNTKQFVFCKCRDRLRDITSLSSILCMRRWISTELIIGRCASRLSFNACEDNLQVSAHFLEYPQCSLCCQSHTL